MQLAQALGEGQLVGGHDSPRRHVGELRALGDEKPPAGAPEARVDAEDANGMHPSSLTERRAPRRSPVRRRILPGSEFYAGAAPHHVQVEFVAIEIVEEGVLILTTKEDVLREHVV